MLIVIDFRYDRKNCRLFEQNDARGAPRGV
jgi:hypothetical protein